MEVKALVRELLFEQDCVIIPGFGGFIANFFSARIDKSTGTFYPPVRKISFNRNLTHNDGLLISKISRSAGLNYSDARRIADSFVKVLTDKLGRGEKVIFDHIGAFSANRENNIEFEPEPNINYLLDSYGLESFQCYPVGDYDVRKRIVRHIDKDPSRHYPIRRTLWRAAIAIPILALIVLVPLKTDLFKTRVESVTLNPLVTAEFENNRKAVEETVTLAPDSAIPVNPVKEDPAGQPAAASSETGAVAETKVYGVVTGSFKSEENAKSHIDMLRAEGFEPEIIEASNGFYRVFAMYCSNLEVAMAKKDSLSGKFPGTWISKR